MWNKRDKNGKFARKGGTSVAPVVIAVNPTVPITQVVAQAVAGSTTVSTVKPKLVNHIAIVLDFSGSMYSIRNETRKHLNQTIRTIVNNATSSDQETTVSFYRFGTNDYPHLPDPPRFLDSSGVTEDYFCTPVGLVKEMTEYLPSGNTPLFDGVGYAIKRLSSRADANDKNVSFLVIVITDGLENASKAYSAQSLNTLMTDVQCTDRWTLSFLLPPQQKASFCRRFAIPVGNVQEWEATFAGVALASHQTQTGVTHYYTARSLGSTQTQSFYTDLSKVDPREVQKNLQNIQDKVKLVKVDKETEISKFIEEKTGRPYSLGTAFYQLTKPEKIQASKQILVKEKTSNAVYGGYDARKILGIPEGQDLKVKPGNHSNYDLYVQSLSTNRKLVRGTALIILK
jgi:hypothetical protein